MAERYTTILFWTYFPFREIGVRGLREKRESGERRW